MTKKSDVIARTRLPVFSAVYDDEWRSFSVHAVELMLLQVVITQSHNSTSHNTCTMPFQCIRLTNSDSTGLLPILVGRYAYLFQLSLFSRSTASSSSVSKAIAITQHCTADLLSGAICKQRKDKVKQAISLNKSTNVLLNCKLECHHSRYHSRSRRPLQRHF